MKIDTQILDGVTQDKLRFMATIDKMDLAENYIGMTLPQEIIREVSKVIADYIIEKHFDEILQKISPEAIANMSIAEAGAKINETLNKKMPDKILEIEKTRTEVYQRGLLGGFKRIK